MRDGGAWTGVRALAAGAYTGQTDGRVRTMGSEWMPPDELDVATWHRGGGEHAVRVGTADGSVTVYGSLDDLERVARRILASVMQAWMAAPPVPCDGPGMCGASAGEPCGPGCPALATDRGGSTDADE